MSTSELSRAASRQEKAGTAPLDQVVDGSLKTRMDTFYLESFRSEDTLCYRAVVQLFLAIWEWEATAYAQEGRLPIHRIEAGDNRGIVPPMRHADFMLKLA